MARARFIRPEFYTDEKVGELSYGARLLFQSIWCQSDLRGVFEYSAKSLRAVTFPYDEGLTSGTVQEWLDTLESKGMIARFEEGDKTWGYVPKWSRYQTISGREVDIDKKMKPEQRRPPPPCCAQVVPGVCPGSAVAPSPAPAPATSPAPAPAPAWAPTEPAAQAPTGGDGGGVKLRLKYYSPEKAARAIQDEDLIALVMSMGGNGHETRQIEWQRDTGGLQLGEVAAIFWRNSKDRIREPSKFRAAREEWEGLPLEFRRSVAHDAIAELMGSK